MKEQRVKDRLDGNPWDSPVSVMFLLIIMMLVSGFVVGCSAPIEGEVVGKDVDPGRTESYWTSEQRACGTERYTQTTTVNGRVATVTKSRTKYCNERVQKTRNVPPSWDLIIRADNGQQHWWEVSRQVYERTKIGDRVNTGNLR